MKYIRTLTLALLTFALIAGSSAPAFAKDGNDDNESSDTSSQSNTSDQQETEGSHETHTPAVNTSTEHETELENRNHAESIVNDLKETRKKETSDATKRQNCENEKAGIKTKASTLGANAARYKTKIDTIFQQAETYQKTNNLTVSNWDALVASASAAQAKAAASVTALQALNTPIDCTQPSVATQVATIKAAAMQARSDLAAYRQAIIALLTALENTNGQGE